MEREIIEYLDNTGLWNEAEVVDKRHDGSIMIHLRYHPCREGDVLLTYDGKSLQDGTPRLAPFGTHLWTGAGLPRVGTFVDFCAAGMHSWGSGVVIEVRPPPHAAALVGDNAKRPRWPALWVPVNANHLARCESRTTQGLTRHVPPSQAYWEKRVDAPAVNDANATTFERGLARNNLRVERVAGDGNCLFRAVADQVFGLQKSHDEELHLLLREWTVSHMRQHADAFKPFCVPEAGGGWEEYLARLASPMQWGDDPEVQALSELFCRQVQVWGYDAAQGAAQMRVFNSDGAAPADGRPPIRLAYSGNSHWDSVRESGAEASRRFEADTRQACAHLCERRGLRGLGAPAARAAAPLSGPAASAGWLPPASSADEAKELAEALRRSRVEFENARSKHGNLAQALDERLTNTPKHARDAQLEAEREREEALERAAGWPCSKCTLVNSAIAVKCGVCEAPRSGALQPSRGGGAPPFLEKQERRGGGGGGGGGSSAGREGGAPAELLRARLFEGTEAFPAEPTAPNVSLIISRSAARGALWHANFLGAERAAAHRPGGTRLLIVQCSNEHRGRIPADTGAGLWVLELPLLDRSDTLLDTRDVEDALAAMEKARTAGVDVLVSCKVGVSRSTSVVLAHLMGGAERLTLRAAWTLDHDARPIACPNPGFVEQLMRREVRLRGPPSSVPPEALVGHPLFEYTYDSPEDGMLRLRIAGGWLPTSLG